MHLPLFFFFFTLFIGCGAIGVFSFLYFKYRLELIRFYLVHHVAYTIFVFLQSLSLYGFLNTNFFAETLLTYKFNAALSLYFVGVMLYYQGRLFFAIAAIEWAQKIQYTVFALACYPVLIATLIFLDFYSKAVSLFEIPFPAGVLTQVSVFTSMGLWFVMYCIYYVTLFRNYRKITNELYRFIAKIYLISPVLFLPLGFIDGYYQNLQIQAGQYVSGIYAQPLMFLIGNLLSFLVLYKAAKLNEEDHGEISETLFMKYSITEREKKIIEMLHQGLSNKEIASKLFLSPHTVRNHISSIFEKTNTSTRGKLISLFNQP